MSLSVSFRGDSTLIVLFKELFSLLIVYPHARGIN